MPITYLAPARTLRVSGKGDEATVKSLTLCPKNTLLSGARDPAIDAQALIFFLL